MIKQNILYKISMMVNMNWYFDKKQYFKVLIQIGLSLWKIKYIFLYNKNLIKLLFKIYKNSLSMKYFGITAKIIKTVIEYSYQFFYIHSFKINWIIFFKGLKLAAVLFINKKKIWNL